jgi:hypothetical protein
MFDTAGTMLTMMVFTSIDLLISSLRLLRLVQSKTRDRIRRQQNQDYHGNNDHRVATAVILAITDGGHR